MDGLVVFAATGDAVARVDGTQVDLRLEGAGVQCVAVDGRDPRRVFAGTFDRGLFGSNDGGERWAPVGEGIPHRRVLAVAVSPSHREDGHSVVYAGTEPSALYRSTDDGRTWQELSALGELPSRDTWSFPPRPWTHHVRWIALHHADPELLVVGIELGGVMRSTDGGVTWEDRKPGACLDPHVLATHPVAHERIYEAAGDGVAVSHDAGVTWTPDTEGMDRTYTWGLAVDPEDPDLWYVSSAPGPGQAHAGRGGSAARLYRKRGPAPWEPLPLAGDAGPFDRMPYALLAPRPGHLLVGMDDGRLLATDDPDDTWRDLGVRLPGLLQLATA